MTLNQNPSPPSRRSGKWIFPLSLVTIFFLVGGVTLDWLLAREGTYSYLKIFNEVLLLVRSNYVEEVQLPGLMEGAYDGLLRSLDPDSEYVSREEYVRLMSEPGPDEGDVGIEPSRRGGYLQIVSVIPGSPADQAGLQPGTRLRRIEGRSTREMTVTAARLLFRGRVGTELEVRRFPGGDGVPELVTLTRARVRIPVADARRADRSVVLRVPRLGSGSATQVRRALKGLEAEAGAPVLLDLRGNSEGRYEEAARVASLFLPDGEVGRIRSRDGQETVLRVHGDAMGAGRRLAVLVDVGTAGPAEFLAQALRVRAGAEVMGSKTFGRATLQEYIPLEGGGMIRLSVARCVGPDGGSWDGDGLEPDHVLGAPEDEGAPAGEDEVLRQALELLESDSARQAA